ncbi:MAG: ATP-binding protein [Ruminococcus sp.]|nr:ATP-binding protein [Ruminococcus sp.]
MSVSAEQEAELKKNTGTEEWKKYFDSNLGDWEEFEENKIITDKMLRNYVRINHHERVKNQLSEAQWDRALNDNGLQKQEFISLCKSHGEELKKLEDVIDDDTATFDMRLCAVLLRLADIFDFDPTRAPASLFKHVGLDKPKDSEMEKSSKEYQKNSAGKIISNNGQYIYSAVLDDPQIKKEVEGYLDWVEEELKKSQAYIKKFNTAWNNLELPQTINRKITLSTCKSGDFHITMDQDRIIELLTGKNLYSDSCVFVRELLQNSIDAILWRGENDSSFNAKEHGKITITTWHDGNGQGWFKIEDNGTGMDENIIEKYFLKAGRSYYDSDDFRRDKKNSSKKSNYKPISRFGIGILSCFLSDSENKLEVSTKRYTNGSKAIRLSVTGLNGLYKLATTEQDRSDWQKMPVPNEEEEYFRNEPGTTICVGMNLFDLGDHRSIKEVVDKYVQFPDITIEYKGIDGPDKYPTKDELTEAIAELKKEHGDTCPIVRKHPIPDELFEKLKKQYRELEWKSVPELVFKYYPLDNYTSGDDLGGVAVCVDVDTKSIIGAFSIGDNTYKIELIAFSRFEEDGSVYVGFRGDTSTELDNKIEELKRSDDEEAKKAVEAYDCLNSGISKTYSCSELSVLLSASEKKLLKYAFLGKIGHSTISYNGVFAGAESIVSGRNIIDVRLLRGSYAPEVNVARDSITKLPIEAAVEFEIIDKSVGLWYYDEISYASGFYYESEMKLSELIKKHHKWESKIFIEDYDGKEKAVSEITKGDSLLLSSFDKRSLYHNIAIAFLKEKYSLSYSVNQNEFFIEDKEENYLDTSDFPVQMFFKFRDNCELLGVISFGGINAYSPEHRFSQWLIKNHKSLESELPTVYKKILDIMIMSNKKTDVIKNLNDTLAQLKNYRNNHFDITDELYLTEDDLVED